MSKTVKVSFGSIPIHEFRGVKIDEEDLEKLKNADEDELIDYYAKKDNNGDVYYGPCYVEKDVFLCCSVFHDFKDNNYITDFFTIGVDLGLADILYTEDWDVDEPYHNIKRNGFHESYDAENPFDINDTDCEMIIRHSVSKGGIVFKFEIEDNEEFDINKLYCLASTEENDILGDDKIDAFHILYGDEVYEAETFETGAEKYADYHIGTVSKFGDIYID